jgi:succinyl-CoA synthetase alpha subunit
MTASYCDLVNITNSILGITTNNKYKYINCDINPEKLCNSIDNTFNNITTNTSLISENNILINNILHKSLDNFINCDQNFSAVEPIVDFVPIYKRLTSTNLNIIIPFCAIILILFSIVFCYRIYNKLNIVKTFKYYYLLSVRVVNEEKDKKWV